MLHPRELPGRLLTLDLEDVPGVATRMRTRLARWGLTSVEDLWQADPLQLRLAWGSVTGARLWYALHGYAVAPPRTQRRSVGHGRVLPPGQRQAPAARILARQLVVKAARRMALLHESSLARTMPTDRILTCRCGMTLVGRGRSSD